ncbi:hypothetical protein [Lyticum sinuosum]|uniref:hypothetical protein n=1 Tax=Lyticum sinuosum TaxID=1332059 RepID=UPI002ACE62C8|nr:hypothetical protein [Lyticum sinuosum]
MLEKKIDNFKKIVENKNIILSYGEIKTENILFWNIDVIISHIRVSYGFFDRNISVGIEDIKIKTKIFDKSIYLNNIPQIFISYRLKDDQNLNKLILLTKKNINKINKINNSDYINNYAKFSFSQPLYKFLLEKNGKYLSDIDINFDYLNDKDNKVNIEDLLIKVTDFEFIDFTEENKASAKKMFKIQDDYIFAGNYTISSKNFDVIKLTDDDYNQKESKSLLNGLNFYSNNKRKIIKNEEGEVLSTDLSGTYFITDCCKFYMKEYKGLRQIIKGNKAFKNRVNTIDGKVEIENYSDLIKGIAYLNGYLQTTKDIRLSPKTQSVENFSNSVTNILANGDKKNLLLNIKQTDVNNLRVNNYSLQDLSKKMNLRTLQSIINGK